MAFAKLNSMKFVGLDGLSHFWSKAKTLIMGQITAEVTARENADTALQQSITDLEASVDEKIGSIDISAALSHIKQYDFVVDSNETLLAWANCTDGSMKSVLVKSGEYTLDGKMINLVNAGTKFVFAEDGNKITVSEYMRGIGATEDYGAVIIGLNVELNNVSSNSVDWYAFYRGMICYNCTGTGTGTHFGRGYGFFECTCSNCTGTGTSNCTNGKGFGFFECKHCSSCRAGNTASATATWGGTNTYIDSDSCDYVAA